MEEMPALLLGAMGALLCCTVLTGHGNPTLAQLRDSPLLMVYNASYGKQAVEYLILQEAQQYSTGAGQRHRLQLWLSAMAFFGDCGVDYKRKAQEAEFQAKLDGTSIDPVTGEPLPLTEEDLTIENMFGYDVGECQAWANSLMQAMLITGLGLRVVVVLLLVFHNRHKRV